jgi:hypothetical protein
VPPIPRSGWAWHRAGAPCGVAISLGPRSPCGRCVTARRCRRSPRPVLRLDRRPAPTTPTRSGPAHQSLASASAASSAVASSATSSGCQRSGVAGVTNNADQHGRGRSRESTAKTARSARSRSRRATSWHCTRDLVPQHERSWLASWRSRARLRRTESHVRRRSRVSEPTGESIVCSTGFAAKTAAGTQGMVTTRQCGTNQLWKTPAGTVVCKSNGGHSATDSMLITGQTYSNSTYIGAWNSITAKAINAKANAALNQQVCASEAQDTWPDRRHDPRHRPGGGAGRRRDPPVPARPRAPRGTRPGQGAGPRLAPGSHLLRDARRDEPAGDASGRLAGSPGRRFRPMDSDPPDAVVAHERAYQHLAGQDIAVDSWSVLGVRTFTTNLPADFGLRASLGRLPQHGRARPTQEAIHDDV